jgi:2,3-bisphosphoglycerate-independent phosphoglycerate mutase
MVLIGDGMADYPLEELGNKTPLEVANTRNMDFIAAVGDIGLVQTIPGGFEPGSDVANMSIFGYDPAKYYTGRGPIEAASMGISMDADDVAFRMNLVSISDDNPPRMLDYSAGHISTDEAKSIIGSLKDELGGEKTVFYPGISYRHILMLKEGLAESLKTTPPHDIIGREIQTYLPQGPGEEYILELMERAAAILKSHQVNQKRRELDKPEANNIWPWGQGRRLTIPSFKDNYGVEAAVISAVDLIRGIGISAGMKSIHVPGATGYLDTNFRGKAEYAIKALNDFDMVFVHVEAPDEAGHGGMIKEKIKAIEDFDELVVGSVLAGTEDLGPLKILVLPDHPTPIKLRTHVSDPVPFAIYSSEKVGSQTRVGHFTERAARNSGEFVEQGHMLINLLMVD